MSRSGRPRVHKHLSREAIARTGLEIIDRDGLEALSLRAVAGSLGVGTMTLYQHVPDREAMVRDIVGLLLAEVDTSQKPGETWDDSIRRVARSLREMTLRHPRAFVLVAAAPTNEPPVLDYARTITELHARQDISQETFARMWSVVDAFLTGFMFGLAQVVTHTEASGETAAADAARESGESDESLAASLAQTLSAEAFERDLDVVIAGLRTTFVGLD